MLECKCANSKDIQLALRLLDPFQRKHWPKWWPRTELMATAIMNQLHKPLTNKRK